MRLLARSLFLVVWPLIASEGVFHYALKQGFRQGSLLLKARKIEGVLADPLTPAVFIRPLKLSQEILAYASSVLGMKTGRAYRTFVELDQDWITQVVIAAYRDKLEIKNFEFPIVGSFPYKGFFDEPDAIALERDLGQTYDVYRRKAPAFSSLGWFADPITSNMLANDQFLIETLFHELVHRNFYFDDKGDFDEAFATWFSHKASRQFLKVAQNVDNKEKTLSELDRQEAADSEISLFISEITRAGNLFYKRPDALAKRASYFTWVTNCLNHYPKLSGLKNAKWNNAVVLAFATYLNLLPPIEAYARERSMSAKDLLASVIASGSTFADRIENKRKSLAGELVNRCDQKIP